MSRLVAVMGGDHCVTVSAACLSHRSLNIQVSKKQNVSFTRDLSRIDIVGSFLDQQVTCSAHEATFKVCQDANFPQLCSYTYYSLYVSWKKKYGILPKFKIPVLEDLESSLLYGISGIN